LDLIGFHYDFNFLTIHGKSRYPGLFAWNRNGQKFKVSVPANHLLLQSGKQFEYLTGGLVTCGFHEVIYTDDVRRVKEEREK
jgi:isopenicillin N synthase-like dioxygenase